MTVFPVLHGKGLELSSQTRFQSRFFRESVSRLRLNTQGQRGRQREWNKKTRERERERAMDVGGRKMEERWLRSRQKGKQSIGKRD